MASQSPIRQRAIRPLTVEVPSETDVDKMYPVTLPYCPCKDFLHRRRPGATKWSCKHIDRAMTEAGYVLPDPAE